MNETLCFFDISSSATFYLKGIKIVKVRTTWNEKLWFSFVLIASISKVDNKYKAITLPPMVIFQNLTKVPKYVFPNGLLIEATKGGIMKRSIMKSRYGSEFWKKRPGYFFQHPKSLLIMDSAKSYLEHVAESFKHTIQSAR